LQLNKKSDALELSLVNAQLVLKHGEFIERRENHEYKISSLYTTCRKSIARTISENNYIALSAKLVGFCVETHLFRVQAHKNLPQLLKQTFHEYFIASCQIYFN